MMLVCRRDKAGRTKNKNGKVVPARMTLSGWVDAAIVVHKALDHVLF